MTGWLIIGGGISGLGAAKLLRAQGKSVRVSNATAIKKANRDVLEGLGCEIEDHGHHVSHLRNIGHVVRSPGATYRPWLGYRSSKERLATLL